MVFCPIFPICIQCIVKTADDLSLFKAEGQHVSSFHSTSLLLIVRANTRSKPSQRDGLLFQQVHSCYTHRPTAHAVPGYVATMLYYWLTSPLGTMPVVDNDVMFDNAEQASGRLDVYVICYGPGNASQSPRSNSRECLAGRVFSLYSSKSILEPT